MNGSPEYELQFDRTPNGNVFVRTKHTNPDTGMVHSGTILMMRSEAIELAKTLLSEDSYKTGPEYKRIFSVEY